MSTTTTTTATELTTKIADNVQHGAQEFEQGQIDTVETPARYLAYLGRYKALVAASSRYLAYSSDVGEAFRPVAGRVFVNAMYGVSFAYVGFDVAYEGYKAKLVGKNQEEVAMTVVKRGVFQGLASLLMPAITIHTVVHQSGRLFKNMANITLRRWGPTAIGLAVVPLLPYMFDHPIETAVDRVFEMLEGGGGKSLPLHPSEKAKVE
ncbi:mitochondrial fission process protein 1 [Entomortierella parvispora]|uniref:Mitochondrial fission process protein 1 n=1 Tax=Entomortierella parvispora TaxID=205924 RepID=A0A9P3H4A6_9FUNG|nr:mitochondrial fission process protein 1 [Entomortierella parvispora]